VLNAAREFSTHAQSQEKTSVAAIGMADLLCPETTALVQSWKKWRGWHALAPYRAWAEADLGAVIAHASMARVLDGGQDYEFEFIGDAHVRAYGIDHRGRRVSDIARLSPRFGRQLKASYDLVRISAHPHAFQGTIGAEHSQARFVWFETAYLPVGANGSVDYILNAAVYRLREGGP
jgi:hypothetical protein